MLISTVKTARMSWTTYMRYECKDRCYWYFFTKLTVKCRVNEATRELLCATTYDFCSWRCWGPAGSVGSKAPEPRLPSRPRRRDAAAPWAWCTSPSRSVCSTHLQQATLVRHKPRRGSHRRSFPYQNYALIANVFFLFNWDNPRLKPYLALLIVFIISVIPHICLHAWKN